MTITEWVYCRAHIARRQTNTRAPKYVCECQRVNGVFCVWCVVHCRAYVLYIAHKFSFHLLSSTVLHAPTEFGSFFNFSVFALWVRCILSSRHFTRISKIKSHLFIVEKIGDDNDVNNDDEKHNFTNDDVESVKRTLMYDWLFVCAVCTIASYHRTVYFSVLNTSLDGYSVHTAFVRSALAHWCWTTSWNSEVVSEIVDCIRCSCA